MDNSDHILCKLICHVFKIQWTTESLRSARFLSVGGKCHNTSHTAIKWCHNRWFPSALQDKTPAVTSLARFWPGLWHVWKQQQLSPVTYTWLTVTKEHGWPQVSSRACTTGGLSQHWVSFFVFYCFSSVLFTFLSSIFFSWPLSDFSHAQIRISFRVVVPWSSPLFSFTVWLTHTHTHSQLHTHIHSSISLAKPKNLYIPLPPTCHQSLHPPAPPINSHTLLLLPPWSLPLDAQIHTNTNAWRDVVIVNEATSFCSRLQGNKTVWRTSWEDFC